MDDSTDVIPPPGANETVQVSIGRQSTAIAWADPSADPSEANGTEAHPYPTLQAAFDSVCSLDGANGCVVLAKAGTYGTGQTDFDYQGYTGHTRLLITNTCRIVAVDGCARTFLVGSPDTSTLSSATAPGCGANAVNAIAMTSLAQVQGFTITGSYSTTGSGYYTPGRGPIFTYGNDLEVTDCVISNNVGAYYAVPLPNL